MFTVILKLLNFSFKVFCLKILSKFQNDHYFFTFRNERLLYKLKTKSVDKIKTVMLDTMQESFSF